MPSSVEASPKAACPAGALALATGSAVFRVHLFVRGNHGGYYEYPTEAEAVMDMERREREYGVLHCRYSLERPKPRCAACKAYAELMSGLGLWRYVPDCDHLPNAESSYRGGPVAASNKPAAQSAHSD